MAYAAAATLKAVVGCLLVEGRPCFRPPCLRLLELALKEIKSFQEFLNGLGCNSRKRMSATLQRVAEAIRTFDDAIDVHLYQSRPKAEEGLLSISREVESLKQEFHAIFDMMNKVKEERFNGDADLGGNKPKMVGLSDVYNKFKNNIVISGGMGLFFLIVGMAGIGKTNFAERFFEDLDILEEFEARVWVTVGKNCELEEIRRRILAQLIPDDTRKHAKGDRHRRMHFEKVLKGKRWLIVLDDVWDARVCSYLGSFLPNIVVGCRVILTSRSRRIVEKAKFVTEIRLLNEKESWILLREKVFVGEKCCPPELEKVGKKIAEKCDGLPLTIIAVADLISKIPESRWIDVATHRKHQVFIDAYQEILKVLYPSYEDIPQQLKSCFLYMAVFPPNYKIPRSKLINIWFVEGLLEPNSAKSSEECSDEYLEEFSSKSLVMVYQRRIRSSLSSSIEETKSCGLHSSWWHLCYTEARKDEFFYVLISREDCLGEDIKSQSRLSIHNNVLFAIKEVHDSIEDNSASTACSLLCFGPYHRYSVPICFGLRFLKNLDVLNIRLYEFPLEVLELGGLKYFALTCDGELPDSISKLRNLQFFIARRHHNIKILGAPSFLPVEIWDMSELKHLQITGSDLPNHPSGTLFPHLSTLLDVSGDSCTKDIFEGTPHLKKLGIQIELAPGVVEPLYCFDHISQLNELETLKCVVVNPADYESGIASLPTPLSIFPLGLKKLTLSGLGYPWKEMIKISSLHCLEVLKLRHNAFRGPIWEVKKRGFSKLGFLVIEDIDLVRWKVNSGCFKMLQSISIKNCYKLTKVQWKFKAKLLDKIEIVDCDPSLEYTLRETLLLQDRIPEKMTVQSSWEEEDDAKP